MMNGTQRTFKLEKIVDLRPIDFLSGKRQPLDAGGGNVCDRCGREHAVVWVVRETTEGNEQTWRVGCGCGPRILDGWTPETTEKKTAEKAARDVARAAAVAKRLSELKAIVSEIVAAVGTVQIIRTASEWSTSYNPIVKVHDDRYPEIEITEPADMTDDEIGPVLRAHIIARLARDRGSKAHEGMAVSYLSDGNDERADDYLWYTKGWRKPA